jgi:hypothetical protein
LQGHGLVSFPARIYPGGNARTTGILSFMVVVGAVFQSLARTSVPSSASTS